MSAQLEQLADLVRRETGISLGRAQWPSLEAALRRVDPALDATAFLRRTTAGRGDAAEVLDRLIDEVTVNETFLFRQRRELDAIDWIGLLEGARGAGRSSVRVWVAACASGEEAYTLAVLASEAFAPALAPVSILATDISPAILEKARRGSYGRRATRAIEPAIRERYFLDTSDGVAVGERVRGMVEFMRHNLVSDPLPTPGAESFDLIACRNVLIYFEGDTVERVIGLLEGGLAPGGTLMLGAADQLCGSALRLAGADASPPKQPRLQPVAKRVARRPLGRERSEEAPVDVPRPAPGPAGEALSAALQAANQGRLGETLELTARLLEANPLDADAHFVRGLAELGVGDTDAAAVSLRRALYVDPAFGLAAFQLGRAHDERGDRTAAARAYEQALRTLEPGDSRHEAILDQVDLGDVAAACSIRLRALREAA